MVDSDSTGLTRCFEDDETTNAYVTVVPQGSVFSDTSDIKRFELQLTQDELSGNSIQHAKQKLLDKGLMDRDIFHEHWRIDTVWPSNARPLPHSATVPPRARE